MLDSILASLVRPVASYLNLSTLPLHVHQLVLAGLFYQLVNARLAPALSRRLFPAIYAGLNRRTRINWNVHVVSLVQSCVINTLALWVLWRDGDERRRMSAEERVWGYTPGGGLVQALAGGYFLWDLVVCAAHLDVFGVGLLMHAVSAATVFSLGFRPFVNYYCPIFILYELSTPFLNFHWFFDKLNMTGSRAQLYNGIVLLATFFLCRLCWGSYQSVRVFRDVWTALHRQQGAQVAIGLEQRNATTVIVKEEVMRYAGEKMVPYWLAMAYLLSNLVLNALNWYWFAKMIDAVRKRFQPPKEKAAAVGPDGDAKATRKDRLSAHVVPISGSQVVEVDRVEVRYRR